MARAAYFVYRPPGDLSWRGSAVFVQRGPVLRGPACVFKLPGCQAAGRAAGRQAAGMLVRRVLRADAALAHG